MIELFFDGACEPINPGGTASYGWLIKQNGKILKQGFGIVGKGTGMTNNIAEYNGLIKGLEEFVKLNKNERLFIKGDSNMVINMVSGQWGWNKKKTKWEPHKKIPHLKKLLNEALNLLNKIDHEVKWVPREQNEEADLLSKKISGV